MLERFIDLQPDQQQLIYAKVKELKQVGLGYKRIRRKIGKEFNVKNREGFRDAYRTQAQGKQLYIFLKSLKEDFKKVKEFVKLYPKEFIQGVADSEGCTAISCRTHLKAGIIVAVSTNQILLSYIQQTMNEKFDIETKLDLLYKPGEGDSYINGRLIKRKTCLYRLTISKKEYVKKYLEQIGFNIDRKQGKLEDALLLLKNHSTKKAAELWREAYQKTGKEWIKKKAIDES